MDAGANASVLPATERREPGRLRRGGGGDAGFRVVRDWVLGIGGGPLVSLAVATNVLAALTGSASGGLTIALDALGATYMAIAAETGLNPALMHRVAVIGSGTLDSLPHNGAVVTLLAVCGSTHRESYFDIVMVGIVGALDSARRRHRGRLPGGFVLSYPRGPVFAEAQKWLHRIHELFHLYVMKRENRAKVRKSQALTSVTSHA